MRNIKTIPNKSLLLLFCSLLLLTACKKKSDHTSLFIGNEMTINYRIIIGKEVTPREKADIEGVIAATFDEVNTIFNKWNPHSELSKLNRMAAHTPIQMSPQMAHCLAITHEVVQLTEKRFDPTVNPLQNLWKKYLSRGGIPPENEISALIPAIGWDKIHLKNGMFSKDLALTSLDLGGIAKGLCVDMLVERLNQQGFPSVFVEWGGEIRVTGIHPEPRPWTISILGIQDSLPEHRIASVELKDEAIATSGDYLQNWTIDGVTYFHIIDPKTLMPLTMHPGSIASASIKAKSCAFADGLATAAMIFPSREEAEQWLTGLLQRYPDLSFWIITR